MKTIDQFPKEVVELAKKILNDTTVMFDETTKYNQGKLIGICEGLKYKADENQLLNKIIEAQGHDFRIEGIPCRYNVDCVYQTEKSKAWYYAYADEHGTNQHSTMFNTEKEARIELNKLPIQYPNRKNLHNDHE